MKFIKIIKFLGFIKKKKIENEHIAINTFNTLRNKKLFKFLKKKQINFLELPAVMLIITVCFVKEI